MEKDRKQPLNQMNPMGEWGTSGDLFGLEVPVWYEKSGKVSSEWLAMCEEERASDDRVTGRNSESKQPGESL
jgi:hypothetical protein